MDLRGHNGLRRRFVPTVLSLVFSLVSLIFLSPAWARIQSVGVASASGVGNTPGISHGLSIQENDVLVAFVHVNGDQRVEDGNGVFAFVEEVDDSGADTNGHAIYSRVAGAAEPASYQWLTAESNRWSVTLRVFRNVDTSAIWEVPPTPAARGQGTGAAAIAPSMEIITSGALGILFVISDTSSQSFGAAGNGYQDGHPVGSQSQASYIRDWDTPGATGPSSVDQSRNDWLIYQIALRPHTGGPDISPPHRYNALPIDELPPGTLSTTISLQTNESAVCRYDSHAGTDYAAMTQPMQTLDGFSHSAVVSGLSVIAPSSFYVRCIDAVGNANDSDFSITVSVGAVNAFQNTLVVSGLNFPVSMAFLPDGGMLVLEWPGTVKIVQPGASSPDLTPFMELGNVGIEGEQGAMDILLDPDFETNGYFYIYFVAGVPNRCRVSRFSVNPNGASADVASEFVVWEDDVAAGTGHHGGDIHFGPDGKLYLAIGDNREPALAQSLSSYRGKALRLNSDGSVPLDNPFHDGEGPNLDAIWALGLRNPFRSSFDAQTGIYYLTDVGVNDAEEVNVGVAGANYGWPTCEGYCEVVGMTNPILDYEHSGTRDTSITGGFVYRGGQFPAEYHESYFFADYAQNVIKRATLAPDGLSVTGVFNFEPPDGTPEGPYGDIVHLLEGPDGALYYVDMGFADHPQPGEPTVSASGIRKIRFETGNQTPTVVVAATPGGGQAPLSVDFSSVGSQDPEGQPLTFQWDFGDGSFSSEANPTHVYATNGVYTARLSVSDSVNTAQSNLIRIEVGNPPQASITSPLDGASFRAGDVINFAGEATDVEDGVLSEDAYYWEVLFRHDTHIHPELQRPGIAGGVLEIPSTGHDFSDFTRFEFKLSVTDADGTVGRDTVTIFPEKVDLLFDTEPSGLSLSIDGITVSTPLTKDTLVGFEHALDAPNQQFGGDSYRFQSWSDGGAQAHNINVPEADGSLVATFTSTPIIASMLPVNGATGVAIAGNLSLEFDEDVFKGSGRVVIRRAADGSIFEAIDVSGERVSVSGRGVTINPFLNLELATGYFVEVDAGAFADTAGNGFEGLLGAGLWGFTTQIEQPPNTAPVLTVIGDQSLFAGETLSLTVTASDAEFDPLSFGSDASGFVSLVDNLDDTATLNISPAEQDVGSVDVTVTVSDGELLDSETFSITVVAPPDSHFALVYSETSDRAGSMPLLGAGISDAIYGRLSPEAGPAGEDISEVRFYLDGASNYFKRERSQPYDLQGGGSNANPWDSTEHADGTHVIRTEVDLSNGELISFETPFVITNNPPPPTENVAPQLAPVGSQNLRVGESRNLTVIASDANGDALSYSSDASGFLGLVDNGDNTATLSMAPTEADLGSHSVTLTVSDGEFTDAATVSIEVSPALSHSFELVYSDTSDRAGSIPMEAAVIGGDVFARLSPESGPSGESISEVRFYLDGASSYFKRERRAPYDFQGGGSNANPWDTTALSDGVHVVRTEVQMSSGELISFDTSFTITN